jgi:RecA/RadA recombinase
MASSKHRKLDAIVARLQLNYGPRAIRLAEPDEKTLPIPRIATSFVELDTALDGGLPQGRITEICGPATSGKLTLAAKAMAVAHRMDRDVLACWIDPSYTCDPDYMHRCGIDLKRLLIVHPANLADALAATLYLAESNTLALLIFDGADVYRPAGIVDPANANLADEAVLAPALARLNSLLPLTATAAVFLTEPNTQSRVLAHTAAIRIMLRREQWIKRDGDVRGYVGQAEIVKNRLGSTGARVPVRIVFNGTVRGNGL